MSLIVAARFDNFADAENAAGTLFRAGFREDAVNIFFVNPPGWHDRYPIGGDQAADPAARGAQYGALAGAAIGGLAGIVIGAGLFYLMARSHLAILAAAATGAYLGSLLGALAVAGSNRRRRPSDARPHQASVRDSGVLLAVHVDSSADDKAARLLAEAGGKDVEQAHGRWRDGKWVDFDPVEPPILHEAVSESGRQVAK